MKLGSLAYITLYSQQYEAMKNFCSALRFQSIHSDSLSSLFTDGNLFFDVRRAERDETTLSYIVHQEMPELIEMAENLGITILESSVNHCVIKEPNGLIISLFAQHIMPLKEAPKKPVSLCGTFAGIYLETDNLEQSTSWWQNAAFKKIIEEPTHRIFDDGKIIVTLYQREANPYKFKNPSFAYLESDMKERIAQIRQNGIEPIEEEKKIGRKGHAILKAPNGQYIFLLQK